MNSVTVEGRALKHALRAVVDVVERRSTIPILTCVRLTHSAAGLTVEGTDLDITISDRIDVIAGEGEWSVCLNAAHLQGIARVAGVMPVLIELGDKVAITLGSGEAHYSLNSYPAADFPDLIVGRGDLIEVFTNGMLVGMLEKVRAFISTEEVRYYLNGICWQTSEQGSRFVATDGHRLAACTYSREARETASRIIPRKAACLLAKHLAGRDVRVFAGVTALGLVFESGSLTVRSKLIDGIFPDVDRVIPKGGAYAIELKRAEIIAALNRVLVIDLGQRVHRVKFANVAGRVSIEGLSGEGDGASVPISSEWPLVGEARARAPAEAFGVNVGYMLDMALACEGNILLQMKGPADPLLVTDADPSMTRVLMPMRV